MRGSGLTLVMLAATVRCETEPMDETARRWGEAASAAKDDKLVGPAARLLLAGLEATGDAREAASTALACLLEAVSQNYFAQPWAAEHEYSVWARLTDDARAWGYGSEEEIEPLRWLTGLTGFWFDGQQLLTAEEWRPRFEAWAEGQRDLVRRMTPGALNPEPFLRGE